MSENGNLKQPLAPDLKAAVIRALEDPRYEWRTIDGLAKQTGLRKATCGKLLKN